MTMFRNLKMGRIVLNDDEFEDDDWALDVKPASAPKVAPGAYSSPPPPQKSMRSSYGGGGGRHDHTRQSNVSVSSILDSDDETYSYSGSRPARHQSMGVASSSAHSSRYGGHDGNRSWAPSETGGSSVDYRYHDGRPVTQSATSRTVSVVGSAMGQRRIVNDELDYENDKDLDWKNQDDKPQLISSDATPDMTLTCPYDIDVEGLFGKEMRVFKRMSDNSTVHIKYNASSHEIFMWGEYSLVKEAKRTMERRFDYLCDNIERITKMNKKRKEDAGRTITRKSDIRRTEKAERFGLVAMDDLRKLPENQTSHRGVFMLPRSDVLPIARLLGPNGKPLDDLRHDLGCRIVFGEREAQEGIIKVAGNSYELVREVLSRLTIHVAKRTYPRPPPVQERLFDVTEKPMEITTERVTANYIPWDLPQDNAWHTSPTVLKGILSGDMFNSSRLTESRSSLEATLTRNIQRFVRFIGLHDGNAKMRICLGTCLVSDISPKLHDLSQKIALKEIFVTQNALMYFSRNLLQSNHQVELLTSRLPSNYRRVDDDYSVGYSFRCEHRSSSASYSPKTAWPNIKLRVWFSREGRASRWEAVIGERRELDLNVIYPNNDYYNKPDWRLEATTWFHSPIKPDSEIGRLVTRMRINERGRLEYSNTDQLVVQQITCKTRILYESADDFQLEITRAQVWNCDPDTDGRDTPTPLLAKSTFESYGATIWPLLWKRLLEDNSHTSIGCVPNYSEGDFFTGNYISKLVDSVHTVQNTLGSVLH